MNRSWPSLVAAAAYATGAGSMLISVIWLVLAPGSSWFEPAVQMLGLVACVCGVAVERRATARERRHLAMSALEEELAKCVAKLDDPRFKRRAETPPRPCVYPRLPVSATDSILVSGVLAGRGDGALLRRLHGWRDAVNEFNRRLDLTELRLFTVGLHKEIGEFERALHSDNGYLNELRHEVRELQGYLGISTESEGAKESASRSRAVAVLVRRGPGRNELVGVAEGRGQVA